MDVDDALRATEQFWQSWASAYRGTEQHAEIITRSLITLKALTYAPTGGIVAAPTTSLVSVQNRYNFSDRSSEDVLAECEKGGLAFLPWHPLAAGGDAAGGGILGRVARRLGATPVQVAIAWLLARSPVIVPIPETSSLAHLDENVAAARIPLSTEDLHELS